MSQLSFTPTGDLEIIPSKTSSNNDFDFLVGEWKIRNKKLKTRLNNCAEWLEFDATGACHNDKPPRVPRGRFCANVSGGDLRWRSDHCLLSGVAESGRRRNSSPAPDESRDCAHQLSLLDRLRQVILEA